MPDKPITITRCGVSIVSYSKKFGIQIPKEIQTSLGWTAHTPITVKRTAKKLVVTKDNDSGNDFVRGVHTSTYLSLELDDAEKLGWDRGDVLLMNVDSHSMTLSVPDGLDFCLDNLIESWLFIKLHEGYGSGAALDYLGTASGRTFTASQLAKWRKGTTPPPNAINLMIQEVMQKVGAVEGKANLQKLLTGIQLVSE